MITPEQLLLKKEDLVAKRKFSEKKEGELPNEIRSLKSEAEKDDEKHNLGLAQKKQIFKWALIISTIYLIAVGFIIYLCYQKNPNGLSDSVIIALLTSTTTTIIGLPALITTSLFPKSKTKKNQTKKITIK